MDLSDIAIPHDSHYTSRVVLPAYSEDFVLNYSNFKEITTFLLIKVTYNGNYDYDVNLGEDSLDPYYNHEPNEYNIEFYYEGDSGHTYPINRLLVLNGSYTNKIGQIYLNNPLGYDVVLDIFHANIAEPIPQPINSAITISNLYYTDVITNQVSCGTGMTGSTEFIISEYKASVSGLTQVVYNIIYSDIISIETEGSFIYILTNTLYYTLKFLTEFDCNQAYCRILFAYSSYLDDSCRYLTPYEVYYNNNSIDCSTQITTTTTSTSTSTSTTTFVPTTTMYISTGSTTTTTMYIPTGSTSTPYIIFSITNILGVCYSPVVARWYVQIANGNFENTNVISESIIPSNYAGITGIYANITDMGYDYFNTASNVIYF
jgi:hypothetical protein